VLRLVYGVRETSWISGTVAAAPDGVATTGCPVLTGLPISGCLLFDSDPEGPVLKVGRPKRGPLAGAFSHPENHGGDSSPPFTARSDHPKGEETKGRAGLLTAIPVATCGDSATPTIIPSCQRNGS
jgi:hypothetical protein